MPFRPHSNAVGLLSELDMDAWVTAPAPSDSINSWSCTTTETDKFFIRYFSGKTLHRHDEDGIEAFPLVHRVDVVSNLLVLKMEDGMVVDVEEDDLPIILETVAELW